MIEVRVGGGRCSACTSTVRVVEVLLQPIDTGMTFRLCVECKNKLIEALQSTEIEPSGMATLSASSEIWSKIAGVVMPPIPPTHPDERIVTDVGACAFDVNGKLVRVGDWVQFYPNDPSNLFHVKLRVTKIDPGFDHHGHTRVWSIFPDVAFPNEGGERWASSVDVEKIEKP